MRVKIVRVPFMIPGWASAQVLWPDTILVKRGVKLRQSLLAHELVHVDQIRRMGVLQFWVGYLVRLLRFGYARHPFELEAHRGAQRFAYLTRASDLLRHYR